LLKLGLYMTYSFNLTGTVLALRADPSIYTPYHIHDLAYPQFLLTNASATIVIRCCQLSDLYPIRPTTHYAGTWTGPLPQIDGPNQKMLRGRELPRAPSAAGSSSGNDLADHAQGFMEMIAGWSLCFFVRFLPGSASWHEYSRRNSGRWSACEKRDIASGFHATAFAVIPALLVTARLFSRFCSMRSAILQAGMLPQRA